MIIRKGAEMKQDLFIELLESVREGGAILRGEKEPSRVFNKELRMIVTLTPDIEQALTEQAQQQGTTPEQLALDSLRQQFVHAAPMEQAPISTPTYVVLGAV